MSSETTKARFAAAHGLTIDDKTGQLLDKVGQPVAYTANYAISGEGSTRRVWRDPETGDQLARFTLTVPYRKDR
jgi:hypothetical protein